MYSKKLVYFFFVLLVAIFRLCGSTPAVLVLRCALHGNSWGCGIKLCSRKTSILYWEILYIHSIKTISISFRGDINL